MWKVSDYPLLSLGSNVEPLSLFRLEDQPFFDYQEKGAVIRGSVVLLFTGLMTSDFKGTDMMHCIPIHFYGNNALYLSSRLIGQDLWVEIEGKHYPDGYFN